MRVAHSVEVGGVNDPTKPVSKDAWNADHVLSGTPGRLLGFGGDGAGAEIAIGAGLAIADGALGLGPIDGGTFN